MDGNQGPATDQKNQPVVDPTKNVLDLVKAAIDRQDDLRASDAALQRSELHRIDDLMASHSQAGETLRRAEAARIDAIRAIDVAAVNRAADVAATQANTLASQVASSAETLRTQVSAAATAATVNLATALEPIQKDIADLRRAQYEAQGQKTQVVDSRAGYNTAWAVAAVVIAALAVIASIGVAVLLSR